MPRVTLTYDPSVEPSLDGLIARLLTATSATFRVPQQLVKIYCREVGKYDLQRRQVEILVEAWPQDQPASDGALASSIVGALDRDYSRYTIGCEVRIIQGVLVSNET